MKFATIAVFALCSSLVVIARADDCGADRYFHPADVNGEQALAQPDQEFTRMRRLANKGNAVEQRNLAVAYESGYLVSRCTDKAEYWYGKAARNGDEIAQQWVERADHFERMRQGRECYDISCYAAAGESVQAMVLDADSRGHYSAPVTINGITLRGMVDTGATWVAMSARAAQQMGITYRNGRQVQLNTANGATSGYAVTLNAVTVGKLTLQQVPAVVTESDMPILIGASFLSRVNMTTDGKRMTLTKR